ncbi:hypothetical protein H4R99_003556 [Coemansia sp. RSA 1722]|nr:hypothetical protein H4R99_003556 [Coemansia sp. RSA 1722]
METLSHIHSEGVCASEKTVDGLESTLAPAMTLKTISSRQQNQEKPSEQEPLPEADWKQALDSKVILGHFGRTVSIGRSNACMLQIGSKTTTISRRHAEIIHKGDAAGYELHVLGFNGVRVNNKLYMKNARQQLRTGDEINFVGIRFRFREPAAPLQQSQEDADEWWPEPVRKRRAEEGARNDDKRIRLVTTSESGVLESSADTLVGGSEIGAFEGVHQPRFAQHLIDCLPSSPPPMTLFGDEPLSDFGGEPLPAPAADVFAATVVDLPAPSAQAPSQPESLPMTKKSIKQGPRAPSAGSKENIRPSSTENKENNADKTAAIATKPGKTKAVRAPKTGKKHDDEMMASLRELLGIVDPSECLANSIDSETEAFLTAKPEQSLALPAGSSLVDLVVQTMVFSARTSHTISDLLRDMAQADGPDAHAWRHHLTWTLFHNRCFGRVERRVKDASDRRAEDKWYYDAARDDCEERRANFGGLVRTARRCTLRDTQYFFKQVPKLPSFRYK